MHHAKNAMRPQSRAGALWAGAGVSNARGADARAGNASAEASLASEGEIASGSVTIVCSVAIGSTSGGRSATRQAGSHADSNGSASMAAIATSHTRWRAAAEERRHPSAATPAMRRRGAPRTAAARMAAIQGCDHI
jgi:hypothetical protein